MYLIGYGYRYFDPTYILVILGVIISLVASARMKSAFSKYSKVRSVSGMTGAQAAERILHRAGIYNVPVELVQGDLTDHYDPKSKVLRLSQSVYHQGSIAAIGVAAHECGHAIQDEKGYAPMKLRSVLVPVTNIGSFISMPMIILGVIMSWNQQLINLGILLFSLVVIFQLVTLPVELDASRRALIALKDTGILQHEEVRQSKKVLTAAALTYVAALAATLLQLLRLVILFGGRRRD